MAKQNFLAGGYYGKLGQTVGQRWKNIRTIRTYVIPHNPRTAVQQANRGKFGDCVFYAQVANQMNFNATCFVHESMTKWNYRMKTARGLQDLGLEELMRFPLYPTDFSVPYLISGASVTRLIDGTHIEVTVEGTLPESKRVLNLILLLPGSEGWKDRLAICQGENTVANPSVFTFRLPEDLTLSDGLQGRFISIDDTDSSTDLISSNQLSIEIATTDVHTFDTTVTAISRQSDYFRFTFAEPFNNGTNAVNGVSLSCVVKGAIVTLSIASPTLINDNGYFALIVPISASAGEEIPALPSGSSLTIGSISSISALVEATAENVTESISDTSDLIREFSTFYDIQNQLGNGYLRFQLDSTPTLQTVASVSAEHKQNPCIYWTTETATRGVSVSGNYVRLALQTGTEGFSLAMVGSYIKPLSDIDVTANGVTYRITSKEYAYDTSGLNAVVTTEAQSEMQNDRIIMVLNVDTYEDVPSITNVVCDESGTMGVLMSGGSYAGRGTFRSVGNYEFTSSECSITLLLSGVSITREGEVGTDFYPTPLDLTLTQGGKRFGIRVRNGDEAILVQNI